MDSQDRSSGQLRISWAWVAAASTLFGIASLATLTVIASVKNVDTLSTVALILAVLAFVIQILVFIAQSVAASQQQNDIMQINAETRSLLSELRTRAQDTNNVLNEQFGKMLDRIIAVSKEPAPGEESQAESSARRDLILGELQNAVEAVRPPEETGDDRRRRRELARVKSWPDSRTMRQLAEDGLGNLDANDAETLRAFASDLESSLLSGVIDGFYLSSRSQNLIRIGVLRIDRDYPPTEAGEEFVRLTSKGRFAARLFLADRPIPQEAAQLFPWLSTARSIPS